jgi:hypothetical protein
MSTLSKEPHKDDYDSYIYNVIVVASPVIVEQREDSFYFSTAGIIRRGLINRESDNAFKAFYLLLSQNLLLLRTYAA